MSEDKTEMAGTSISTPHWIAGSLTVAEGRDPLGFQTTTQDRLMPVLLPGILELTRRARYFSFHAFLLDEYRLRRFPSDGKVLSDFIKRCEWDFGLAVQRCPNHCDSSPVGARRLGNVAAGPGPFPRGESVESRLGGYGLYYRSPMSTLGVVATEGTLLGDQPTPIDLLYKTDRAARLAEGFRSAVSQTAYYKKWMWTNEELPAEVVDEYANACCLCRLPERPTERDAVYDLIFGTEPISSHPTGERPVENDSTEAINAEVVQRRFSVCHFLTLIDANPDVVNNESTFREMLWSPPVARNENQRVIADRWAALIAKDVWQEAICSVWAEFCRDGRKKVRELGRGLTWEETKTLVINMIKGPPELRSEQPTSELVEALASGSLIVSDTDGTKFNIQDISFEMLRTLIERLNTGTSGLIGMLELARRAEKRVGVGWQQASNISSAWQPSIASVLGGLSTHLDGKPSVGDSIWWMVSKFILNVHERICYSKLPEFTFRFRREEELLRFYDYGNDRFPLAAIRNQPLTSLTKDLGLWQEVSLNDSRGVLTDRGRAFVSEVFG